MEVTPTGTVQVVGFAGLAKGTLTVWALAPPIDQNAAQRTSPNFAARSKIPAKVCEANTFGF
jgi:hypothetical protein